MPNNIQTIIDKFEGEYCNNHNRKIRWLRGAFIDEEDQILTIEQFLKDSLTSMLDEVSHKAGYYMNDGQLDLMDIKRLIQDIKEGK